MPRLTQPSNTFSHSQNDLIDKATWEAISKMPTFTLRQASCVIANILPTKHIGKTTLPPLAESYLGLLRRAVKIKALPTIELWIQGYGIGLSQVDPTRITASDIVSDSTLVEKSAIREWCRQNFKPWPFSDDTKVSPISNFPPELRAAIDAFEAVSRDQNATKRNSPKGALRAWLDTNRTDLSEGARDRIATVANWQPKGGAPKTPG